MRVNIFRGITHKNMYWVQFSILQIKYFLLDFSLVIHIITYLNFPIPKSINLFEFDKTQLLS